MIIVFINSVSSFGSIDINIIFGSSNDCPLLSCELNIFDKLEFILDGGVRWGTHVFIALAAGGKACSFGKMFLFSLAAGGQKGVEKLLQNMQDEIRRNMVLMGCKNLKEIDSSKIIYRK